MNRWILIAVVSLASASAWGAQPNVILMMADDMGYGDTGFNGNEVIRTPHLDQLGATDNTLIFFCSDNGSEGKEVKGRKAGTTGGLRGRKQSLYDGGVRVPAAAVRPGRILPGQTERGHYQEPEQKSAGVDEHHAGFGGRFAGG